MFPGGSPELVEPIYKNPILSAPFNEQLAAAVRAYALDRLQVSILSITASASDTHRPSYVKKQGRCSDMYGPLCGRCCQQGRRCG